MTGHPSSIYFQIIFFYLYTVNTTSLFTCDSIDLHISKFKYGGALKQSSKLIHSFVPHSSLPSTMLGPSYSNSIVTQRLVTQYNS